MRRSRSNSGFQGEFQPLLDVRALYRVQGSVLSELHAEGAGMDLFDSRFAERGGLSGLERDTNVDWVVDAQAGHEGQHFFQFAEFLWEGNNGLFFCCCRTVVMPKPLRAEVPTVHTETCM